MKVKMLLGLLLLFPLSVVFAAPGDLDPSFGVTGVVITDFGSTDQIYDVAIQSDGKIVVAGSSGGDFALARYNSDGTLDPSFDADGKLTTDFGKSGDIATAIAIQSDGKIVAAGFNGPGGEDFCLARYNLDGSLDPGFGVSGQVVTHLGGADLILDIAIQLDGKIVAAGYTLAGWHFASVRYNPDGSLDASFGVSGVAITDFGSSDEGHAVAIQSDGKIVTAGFRGAFSPTGDFALARYTSNGTLDSSFDADGKVTTDFGGFDQIRGMAIQSDGKIVGAGFTLQATNNFALARYNPDGSLDSSFDTDGRVITDLGGGDSAVDIALQSDGKLVVAGNSSGDMALARYNPDGSLDPSFGVNGQVTTDLGSNDVTLAVAIQSDGRIVAAGTSSGDFVLARYEGDEPDAVPTVSGWGVTIIALLLLSALPLVLSSRRIGLARSR